jgi:hypothetical protein
MTGKPGNKGGRPRFTWAPEAEGQVLAAAFAGASDRIIAGILGCAESTLRTRFSVELRKQRSLRQLAVLSWQQAAAKKGNPAMLIWIGKQPVEKGGLGQRDEVTLGGKPDWDAMSDAELEAIAKGTAKPRLRVERGGKG